MSHQDVRPAGGCRWRFHEHPLPPDGGEEESTADAAGVESGGVARVERLPGNVGYLDTRRFHPAVYVLTLGAAGPRAAVSREARAAVETLETAGISAA